MTSEKDHYILDTRSCVGNCALWWAPDGQGYVCDLTKAGLYTFEEASSHRDTDVPVHRDVAHCLSVTHVRLDVLRQNGAVPEPDVDSLADLQADMSAIVECAESEQHEGGSKHYAWKRAYALSFPDVSDRACTLGLDRWNEGALSYEEDVKALAKIIETAASEDND